VTPLTLHDLAVLAEHFEKPPLETWRRVVHAAVLPPSGQLQMRKHEDMRCIFLQSDNTCAVYAAQPRSCSFFHCRQDDQQFVVPWSVTPTSLPDPEAAWQHRVAMEITKTYVYKHGTTFHQGDYVAGLAAIERNAGNDPNAGRNPPYAYVAAAGGTSCPYGADSYSETTLTLDDIERIAEALEIGIDDFFAEFLDDSRGTAGLFRLGGNGHCVFLEENDRCRIENAKPFHCRHASEATGHDQSVRDHVFAGRSTIQEIYRHQLAVNITRHYIDDVGLAYDYNAFRRAMGRLEWLASDQRELIRFWERLHEAPHNSDSGYAYH